MSGDFSGKFSVTRLVKYRLNTVMDDSLSFGSNTQSYQSGINDSSMLLFLIGDRECDISYIGVAVSLRYVWHKSLFVTDKGISVCGCLLDSNSARCEWSIVRRQKYLTDWLPFIFLNNRLSLATFLIPLNPFSYQFSEFSSSSTTGFHCAMVCVSHWWIHSRMENCFALQV